MKKIFCFILGIFSYICFFPIAESLTEFVCGFIETLKIKNTKKVMIGNNEIADLQEKLEPKYTSCIGFQAPEKEDYEDYYEEDKLKNPIGFKIYKDHSQ